MAANPLIQLGLLGQSPWFDSITRELLQTGELRRLIAEDGLRGMTTNPTIFEKAVTGSDHYDADIRALADSGLKPGEIFETLAVADVRTACELFLPLYGASEGSDGFVSIEVSPELANDTDATVREARRLWEAVDRPNVMIKIPGTQAGLAAITRCLTRGLNVNVTLLFSVERYRQVMEAHLTGLEQRRARREPINRVASVASFFVSRVDTKLDPLLEKSGDAAARGLRGTIAIANALVAYEAFQQTYRGPRWDALAREGARVQRPLWASTSTKDPALPDTYYVEALIAPDTVNTLPPETFKAYRDHGRPEVRISEQAVSEAKQRLATLAAAGCNLEDVTRALETEGVEKFSASFSTLLNGVGQKAMALSGAS
jgi:transaldolase